MQKISWKSCRKVWITEQYSCWRNLLWNVFFFFQKNVNLSKSKLGRGQGVERREEGSGESQWIFHSVFSSVPWNAVVFEMFQFDIFESRNPCYSRMFVSSVRLYTVKKRNKNVQQQTRFKITRQKVLINMQNFQKLLRCWETFSPSLENLFEIYFCQKVIGVELQFHKGSGKSAIHISWNFT